MLFNSIEFLWFFPSVTVLFFLLPHRMRWALLLGSSCYFYMCFIPEYILILLGTIVVDYIAGILIEGASGKRRRFYLAASIVANVGVLAVFKYFNFANSSLASLATAIGWNYSIDSLSIILPVGLSFHTFQAMSYTFEVYYGRQQAERHFGIYALYVMFYPQLVAGPIERPQNLLPQFHSQQAFDWRRARDGMTLMLWGLFKKVVIADRLAIYVDAVYGNPAGHSGADMIVATYCFAIQIFCDFSGYSDIAIGAARVMGFKLMNNFRMPYLSQSVREFWQRWHISLSTWFRDYLYIPLGGNRLGRWRYYRNILLTFTISGLWHGANWTFVVWGALHGLFVIAETALDSRRSTAPNQIVAAARGVASQLFRIFLTFHLVLIAWVFFRANSFTDAWTILSGAAQSDLGDLFGLKVSFAPARDLLLMIAIIFSAAFWESNAARLAPKLSPLIQLLALSVQFWLIVIYGVFNTRQFIYFQF